MEEKNNVVESGSFTEYLNREIGFRVDLINEKRERIATLNAELAKLTSEVANLKDTKAILEGKEIHTEDKSKGVTITDLSISMKKEESDKKVKELEATRPCPYKSFAELLNRFLDDEMITSKDLAELLKVKACNLSSWKNNVTIPSKDVRESIANIFPNISANTIKKCDVLNAIALSEKMPRSSFAKRV